MVAKTKHARIEREPQTEKRARIATNPDDMYVSWRIGEADLGGDWSWTKVTPNEATSIHAKLGQIEKLTWGVACDGGKPIAGKRLQGAPPKLRARATELFGDDLDFMYAIRLSGLERIWGIRRGSVFSIVWWDPGHTAWPSAKKHT